MNISDILIKKFKDYNCQSIVKNEISTFEIINPFWEENITVITEGEELIFSFSYQHAHFSNDVDSIFKYISNFLEAKQVVVEFFMNDNKIFGGDRSINELDKSTGDTILKSFFNNDEIYAQYKNCLQGQRCCCKIRCWNNKYNEDIDFILN